MPSEPVSKIRGIGEDKEKKLAKLKIRSKLDLILHLPFRYQDRTRTTRIADLKPGEHSFVQGIVDDVPDTLPRHGSVYIAIRDESNRRLYMRLINPRWSLPARLRVGGWLRLYGVVRTGPKGLEMVHPEWLAFTSDPGPAKPEFVPVYRTTAGLSSRYLRNLIRNTLNEVSFLPKFKHNGLTLSEAIKACHNPDTSSDMGNASRARARVAFDELLAYNLLQRRRRLQQTTYSTDALEKKSNIAQSFLAFLGFRLTDAQIRVSKEILKDVSSTRPMLRLLQGDVGSGKTVVATLAILRAADNDVQTAFMAPTELLAEQHYETLSKWLEPLGVQVGLVTGSMSAATKRARKEAIASGHDAVVVGTHALFQDWVHFKSLGLTIIDEQHRFGVHQRMMLRDKGRLPHQLIMTATPIPRTLALYLFADMDVSIIDELPPGRKPITTTIHSDQYRDDVILALARHLQAGNQAYWVCAAINEDASDEEKELIGTEDVIRELNEKIPTASVGHVHGQMPSSEKQRTMTAFREGETDVLVATTVIEVGVDVPNASLMIIDNAENMGLAQLHQLRGRVGRGTQASFCMLNYKPTLSSLQRTRLTSLRVSQDGFQLAELDLRIRGSGEVFGTKQSGTENFRIANLEDHHHLIQEASRVGSKLMVEDEALAGAIIETWSPTESDYASV